MSFGCDNHPQCRDEAMAHAEAACAAQRLKLTPVRRRTLEILLESHEALGAYDVLARLAQDGFGDKPPVAYRALTFLVENGFAHKIERLNAFIACTESHSPHAPVFMICRSCGTVAEAPSEELLRAPAEAAGFTVETTVIEAEGLCPACQGSAA